MSGARGTAVWGALRHLKRMYRRLFPAPAIRLPGKFPWIQPKPLPAGTVLIEGNPPIVADGKGGITVMGFGGQFRANPAEKARLSGPA